MFSKLALYQTVLVNTEYKDATHEYVNLRSLDNTVKNLLFGLFFVVVFFRLTRFFFAARH